MNRFNKFSIILLLCIFSNAAIFAQVDKEKKKSPAEKIEQYWFVLLKTGPKSDFDSATKAKLFEGHMANINKLYYDGILKVAGPFGKNDFAWRGIFVFDCKTKEEAEKYVSSDPAVAAGLFAVDIVPWYSEAVGSFVHGKPGKENKTP
jgi:uncharacterized protein YciI